MKKNRKILYLIYLLGDLALIILSFYCIAFLTKISSSFILPNQYIFLLVSLIIVWLFSSQSTGLYEDFRGKNFGIELTAIIKNIFVQIAAYIVILFVLREYEYTRSFVFFYSSLLFLLLISEKLVLRKVMLYLRRRGRNLRNVLIVGAGQVGMTIYNAYKTNQDLGYQILGLVDDEVKPYLNGEYLGKVSEVNELIKNQQVDNVVIALPNSANDKIEKVAALCKMNSIRVKRIPEYFKHISRNSGTLIIDKFPMISIRGEKLNEIHWKVIKRLFDIFISAVFLVAFSWWLFPLIALGIKLTSTGPVIFKQERWGRDNKRFNTYKFRTMYSGNHQFDKAGNFVQTSKNDPRITKFGKFLRKTSLDETPQFWNVLRGDMAIIGPRPYPTPLNLELQDKVGLYVLRHLIKPGLTGWAQVNGFRGGEILSKNLESRLQYDLWYIENWSLWLDIEIIVLTIVRLLKGDPNAF